MATAETASKTATGQKKALVISNGQYHCFPQLTNAENDANSIVSALESIGFKVEKNLNLNHIGMWQCLAKFQSSVEQNDLVLFYFLGYAVQWKEQTFLVPIEPDKANDSDIPEVVQTLHKMQQSQDVSDGCFKRLQKFLIHVQSYVNDVSVNYPSMTVCLLDCCRACVLHSAHLDQFLSYHKNRGASRSRLSPVTNCTQAIIAFAYSTELPSGVDPIERSGLFTKHLVSRITWRDTALIDILHLVNEAVADESHQRQIPHYDDPRLTSDEIFLNSSETGFYEHNARSLMGSHPYCSGHGCPKCFRCTDWLFTGNKVTWDWIRTWTRWGGADWNRWKRDRLWEHLTKRGDATCLVGLHGLPDGLIDGFSVPLNSFSGLPESEKLMRDGNRDAKFEKQKKDEGRRSRFGYITAGNNGFGYPLCFGSYCTGSNSICFFYDDHGHGYGPFFNEDTSFLHICLCD